jgi:pre-rRNA-processing protein IPI3
MHLQETIFCATAPSTSSSGSGAISLHDIQTGSTFAAFKQTSAAPHCTAFVESKNAKGGFMLASQPDKSILNVYNFQKVPFYATFSCCNFLNGVQNQVMLKIVLPEKLSCIAVDRRGDFCVGGTAQGRIYLWEASDSIAADEPA